MKAIYYEEPGTLRYMPLPDGQADVWLRREIAAVSDEDGRTCWECEEVHARVRMTEEAVLAHADEIWTGQAPEPPTTEERVSEVEEGYAMVMDALAELSEVVSGLMGGE